MSSGFTQDALAAVCYAPLPTRHYLNPLDMSDQIADRDPNSTLEPFLDRRTRALSSHSTCPESQPVEALQVLLAAIHAVVRPQRAVFNDMVDHGKSLHNMDWDRRLIAPHRAYDERV